MSAYSISKGTWSPVSQAVSTSTGGGSRNKDSENTAAGRTMVGFALFSPTPGSLSKAAMGVAVGGGWLPPKSKADSVQATELTNLAMETNLINFGRDGNLGSLAWTTSSSSNSLSSLAGARVVILPGGTEALVVGGVTTTKNGGLPFDSMPIIDLVTGAVLLQKTQSPIFSGPPLPRYGHCVVLLRDDKLTNDLYTLDLKTWRWTQQSPKGQNSGPPPVRDHQCIRVGDQLLSFLGFNSNLWPASSTDPGYPSAPPIYVLSVPQWTWSRQFTPIPGTPPPPPPPNVSTDGSKGKISGVGIAFGVVFGLAFVGMVAYLVFSHKRRQRKKKEVLIQIELEERRKEEAKLEKERQKKEQEGLPPIPPPSSIPSDHVSGNMGGPMFYGNNGYGQHDNYMQPYASPGMSNFGGPAYMPQQNPFHNPAYQSDPPVGPNPFHSPVPAPAAQYYSPHPSPTPLPMNMPQHPAYSQEGPSSYVPEEMGHTSPTLPPAQQYQQHQPHYPPGGYLGPPGSMASPAQGTSLVNAGARDKFSFIEPTSTYR
ncbi:hypothetical protein BGW38_005247 [Lunasporangiospora selenospora]|uniref:Uncharacterized protein n=1 Tax=Lunasporangiospora selenospora TaxID=979761 RepID=A0A9P6FP01_9FUNG|nr:hypothetical protein BGW38_005247 [Lunasporangiospora selenospora]